MPIKSRGPDYISLQYSVLILPKIADLTGRLLLLQGNLIGHKDTIVTYNATNKFQQVFFFTHLLKVVSYHSKGPLFLMEDSNITLNSFSGNAHVLSTSRT